MKRLCTLLLAVVFVLTSVIAMADDSWFKPYDETVTVSFGRRTASPTFPDGESLIDSAVTIQYRNRKQMADSG